MAAANKVWISKTDQLPDTCISCGMYCDRRVIVKHVDQTEKFVPATSGDGLGGLGCLFFFLGPLGSLLSLALSAKKQRSGRMRKATVKTKTQVPQCTLCASQQPIRACDSLPETQLLAFEAHAKFVRDFESLN